MNKAKILTEHVVAGVRGISGVTHDGTHVWFVDRFANDLVALDPDDGKVVRRLGGLGVTSGLTFDGKSLWGLATRTLLEIEPASGTVLSSVEIPAGCSGIGWAAGSIWAGSFRGKEVLKIDPRTGEIQQRLSADRFVTGVTWCDGSLWYGAWDSDNEETLGDAEIRRVDAASGEILDRLGTDFATSGVAANPSGELWCGDSVNGRVRSLRP